MAEVGRHQHRPEVTTERQRNKPCKHLIHCVMVGATTFQAASCRCNGPAVPRAAALPTTSLHVACALTSPQPARGLSWKATVFGKHQWLRPQPALSQRRGGARQPLGAAATDGRGIVLVTREAGKNGKLKSKIEEAGLGCLEIPLIETAPGPDRCEPHTFEKKSIAATCRMCCSEFSL